MTGPVSGGAVLRAVHGFDASVDRWFDEHLRGRPAADRVFFALSALGDWSLLWHLVGLVDGLVSPDGPRAALRLSGALGVESLLVNQGVKRLFRRARPVLDGDLPAGVRRPSTSSFPSGHASSAAFAAVLLSRRHRALAPAFVVLAAAVAASRVHTRLHHASDVLVGAALGAALAAAAERVLPR